MDVDLLAAIFSRDVKKEAMEIARQLEFGCCHINGPIVYDEAQMPLGGMKASGYGRFGGHAGINEFTEVHWVSVEDPRAALSDLALLPALYVNRARPQMSKRH
jgi:acyl-CoA reductase-like NAD-dependent aldehyde dehydrogenase